MIRTIVGPMLYQAQQWLRSSATILRPRNITDRLVVGSADQGASDAVPLSVDAGSVTARAIASRGITYVDGAIVITEQAANLTCSSVTLMSGSGTASSLGIIMKGDKLVFEFLCGANGTVKYLFIPLDGLNCTWVQTATAP